MANEDMDGMLSQDDINAALEAAGMTPEVSSDNAESAGGGEFSQDDIDAALRAAGMGGDEGGGSAEPAPAAEPDDRVDSSGRPFDEVAAAMAAAIESERAEAQAQPNAGQSGLSPAGDAKPIEMPSLDLEIGDKNDSQGIDLLRDVELAVKIELGRSRMLVDDVLRLGEGSVVELDKLAGDPVDVFVNNRLVARGEVLVLNDNFCVRINDILSLEEDEEEE